MTDRTERYAEESGQALRQAERQGRRHLDGQRRRQAKKADIQGRQADRQSEKADSEVERNTERGGKQ